MIKLSPSFFPSASAKWSILFKLHVYPLMDPVWLWSINAHAIAYTFLFWLVEFMVAVKWIDSEFHQVILYIMQSWVAVISHVCIVHTVAVISVFFRRNQFITLLKVRFLHENGISNHHRENGWLIVALSEFISSKKSVVSFYLSSNSLPILFRLSSSYVVSLMWFTSFM